MIQENAALVLKKTLYRDVNNALHIRKPVQFYEVKFSDQKQKIISENGQD